MAKGKIEPRSKWREGIKERLKRTRLDAGLSQREMAKRLGIEPSAYAKYENRSALPAHLVPDVCRVLNMDPWYLLTGRFGDAPTGGAPARGPLDVKAAPKIATSMSGGV